MDRLEGELEVLDVGPLCLELSLVFGVLNRRDDKPAKSFVSITLLDEGSKTWTYQGSSLLHVFDQTIELGTVTVPFRFLVLQKSQEQKLRLWTGVFIWWVGNRD